MTFFQALKSSTSKNFIKLKKVTLKFQKYGDS